MRFRSFLLALSALLALIAVAPAAEAAPGCSDAVDGGCEATLCLYLGIARGCHDTDGLIACPHWGCWPPLPP